MKTNAKIVPTDTYLIDTESLAITNRLIKRLEFASYTVQFVPVQGAITIARGLTPNEIMAFLNECLADGLIPAAVYVYTTHNVLRLRRLFKYSKDVEGE